MTVVFATDSNFILDSLVNNAFTKKQRSIRTKPKTASPECPAGFKVQAARYLLQEAESNIDRP